MCTKRANGFTLLELTIALGVFLILAVLITGIFIGIIKRQQESISKQNLVTDMRFAMELITREAQTAQDFKVNTVPPNASQGNGACGIADINSCLLMINQAGEYVTYYRNNDLYPLVMRQVWTQNGSDYTIDPSTPAASLTSPASNSEILRFNSVVESPNEQPRVTLIFEASARDHLEDSLLLQTTVSSRYYGIAQ